MHIAGKGACLCFDAKTGESPWKRTVRKVRDEVASAPNNPATCTPASDGESVVAFFPDAGLLCYSVEGIERWHVDLGPFHGMHGITGSPILKAAAQWEELSTTLLGEPCFATPAIHDGRLYLRTSKMLYCFGLRSPNRN